jgi:hypothetical protein
MNPKLNATKTPTALDIAWAAGVYEGEGTIAAKPTTRKHKDKIYRSIADYLSVSQNDPEILYRLRDLFGGSVYRYVVYQRNPKGLPIHRWTIHGQRARNFVDLIYPWLSTRRKSQVDQVRALLSYPVETVRSGSRGDENKIQSDLGSDVKSAAETTAPERLQ